VVIRIAVFADDGDDKVIVTFEAVDEMLKYVNETLNSTLLWSVYEP